MALASIVALAKMALMLKDLIVGFGWQQDGGSVVTKRQVEYDDLHTNVVVLVSVYTCI